MPAHEPATKEPVSYGSDTPPLVRDALTAVRLLRQRRGREALDPAGH
jgi:hypothetical protein